MGALVVYARGTRYNFPFLHDRTVDKGANAIATLLYCTIRHFKTVGVSRSVDTLYIQCDGGSENINRTIFGLCDMFIRMGWFKHVYLNRLPVGHSHQLIDQYFSVLHPRVRTANSRDLPEFVSNLIGAKYANTSIQANIIWLQNAFDFRELFKDVTRIYGMRKRIYGWYFTCEVDIEDIIPRHHVDVWYVLNSGMNKKINI